MNAEPTTQDLLFEAIKSSLHPDVSLVHVISELLDMSYDSAYRRLRGEKELSLDELTKLSLHYKISIDSLINLKSDNIVFKTLFLSDQGISFSGWLESTLSQVKLINSFSERELIYSAKDVPIFHYFEFPELFAFKTHFWHKSLIPSTEFNERFITLELADSLLLLGRQIATIYSKIPTSELWNEEVFNSIIRQIEFSYVSGYFSRKENAFRLCDVLEKMICHMKQQAELGFRFHYGSTPEGIEGSYKLYFNEVLLGDNTVFVKMNGNPTAYITYNVINLLITNNPVFCQQIEKSLRILMHESTLISATSSKDRNRYFNNLLEKINGLRKRME
ncbi:MAG: hypothetical protein AB9834_06000 [Lentimicrobium sp.]